MTSHKGRGYIGKSMSVNASLSSAKPMSRWTRDEVKEVIANELGVEKEDITLLKPYKQYLEYDSWHHTGALYNKTDFYKVVFNMNDIKLSDRAKEQVEEQERYGNRTEKEKIQGNIILYTSIINRLTKELEKVKSFGNDYKIVSDDYDWKMHKKISLMFNDVSGDMDKVISSTKYKDTESKEDIINRIIREHEADIKLYKDKLEKQISDLQQQLEDLQILTR